MITSPIRHRGGTRSGIERRKRQVLYMQKDLRSGQDRRSGRDRRQGIGRYTYVERRDIFLHEN